MSATTLPVPNGVFGSLARCKKSVALVFTEANIDKLRAAFNDRLGNS